MEHLSTFAYVDTKLRSSNKTYSKLNTKKGKKIFHVTKSIQWTLLKYPGESNLYPCIFNLAYSTIYLFFFFSVKFQKGMGFFLKKGF